MWCLEAKQTWNDLRLQRLNQLLKLSRLEVPYSLNVSIWNWKLSELCTCVSPYACGSFYLLGTDTFLKSLISTTDVPVSRTMFVKHTSAPHIGEDFCKSPIYSPIMRPNLRFRKVHMKWYTFNRLIVNTTICCTSIIQWCIIMPLNKFIYEWD